LSDGQELLVSAPAGGGASDIGVGLPFEAADLRQLFRSVLGELGSSLRSAGPDEVTVELGLDVTVEAGKLIGLVAAGGTKAAFTISAMWRRDPQPAEGTSSSGDQSAEGAAATTAPDDQHGS
jgi:hypothetical protein